jgi:hypothetical protein
MSNLMTASRQWATRPVDERFWGLDDMLAAVQKRTDESRQASFPASTIAATASGDDMVIVGPAKIPAALTHYSIRPAGAIRRGAGRIPSLNSVTFGSVMHQLRDAIAEE